MKKRKLILMLSLWGLAVCCNNPPDGDASEVDKEVKGFAESYFNYDFEKAALYCTPESEIWLRYACSNIHQADIDVLRNAPEGASIEINNYQYDDNDTTGLAILTVRNYMQLDTIGKAGRIIDKKTFNIPIVQREGKWMINLHELLRGKS